MIDLPQKLKRILRKVQIYLKIRYILLFHSRSFFTLKQAVPFFVVTAFFLIVVGLLFNNIATIKADPPPIPTVTVNMPTEGFIGENFTFTLNFSNTGFDPGFAPYIDMIFPYNGADGVYPYDPGQERDGIDFIGATFLGTPVTATTLQFTQDNAGCVTHPYAVDTAGAKIQVCGVPGDKLVVLQMPFGSFVSGQPNVDVVVSGSIHNWADEGASLSVQTRGGFQFGETPINDFATDPSIIGTFAHNYITPRIITLSKTSNAPEGETATGPNFVRQFTVTANIASGQTISNFQLTDKLPNNIAYSGFGSALPSGSSVVTSPTVGTPSNAPNNELDVLWTNLTGGIGASDATMSFSFFGPQLDANGLPVIPLSGGCVNAINDALASGTWDPEDPRDLTTVVTSDATPNDYTLRLCSHTVRKSVANVSDVGPTGNTPGDTMRYSMRYEVSDFFSYDSVLLEDTMSDGQRLDTALQQPTFSLTMKGSTASGNISATNYSQVDHFTGGSPAVSPIDGSQDIIMALSEELSDRSFLLNGRIIGGCVPISGGSINCTGSSATTGIITFDAKIQQLFSDDFAPQNANVDQGDTFSNIVDLSGRILNNSDLSPTLSVISEGSSANFTIINGLLTTKTIYAVNGITGVFTNPKIGPGDTITYKIRFNLPVSDVENLVITDYLPLPVFSATSITSFSPTVDATVPAVGHSKFGPEDTFHAFSGITPAMSIDASSNTIVWNFGSYQTGSESSQIIDILFTVPASDQPFADGLFLTNQAQSSQGTTNSSVTTATQIVQIELTLPDVRITKGAVASTQPEAVFAPTIVGPTTFSMPGSSCHRFSSQINSANLASNPINSDISQIDAGDIVTFAAVLENQGQGVNGAFDVKVRDSLPAGFTIPSGGINLCVRDGNGAVVPYTSIDGGDSNPYLEDGIEFTDGLTEGALKTFDDSNGENIIVITYDLEVVGNVIPESEHVNTAVLFGYAATESGPTFVPDPVSDTVTTTISPLILQKSIAGTNIVETSGNNLVIGEIVDYSVVITIPEGQTNTLNFVDSLDSGLALHSITSISTSPGLTTSHVGGFAGVQSDVIVGPNGSTMTLNFETITNANRDNNTAETITVVYRAVVVNQSGIVRGTTLNNSVTVEHSSPVISQSVSAPNVTVVEPTLQVLKTASANNADTGDIITFTVTVSHSGTSNSVAHEVTVSDILPAGLNYAGNLQHISGIAPNVLSESAGTITASWNSLSTVQTSSFSFNVSVGSVTMGQSITNTATVVWSSMAGIVLSPQSSYNSSSTERTGSTSDPGGVANNYRASENEVITVFSSTPTKTIATTSESHTGVVSSVNRVAVGEIVRYRLTIRVAEATAINLQLQDLLPAGLQFINDNTAKVAFVSNGGGISSSTLIPASISCNGGAEPDLLFSGNESTLATIIPECVLPDTAVSSNTSSNVDTYTSGTDPFFKLGNITNADTDTDQEFVVVEFNALVLNITTNQSNTTLNNTFNVLVNSINIGSSTSGTASRVIVAEPIISVVKTVTTTPVDAGDGVAFNLVVTNTSSGNNAAAAFNIVATDDFVPANITVSTVVVSTPHSYVNNTTGDLVSVELDRLNPGQSATITVTGTVNSNVGPTQTLVNTVAARYTSLPSSTGTTPNTTGSVAGVAGSSTGERTGQDGVGQLNDYVASGNASVTLGSATIEKMAPIPTAYAIGETPVFYLKITLPEGTTNDVRVTDILPVGLDYGAYSLLTSATPGVLDQNFGGTIPTPSVSGGANHGDDVTFTFSTITTGNDNNPNNNAFILQVTTTVTNTPTNQLGSILVNGASLVYENPNNVSNDITVTASPTQSVTVKEPILVISKVATSIPSPVESGSVITYQITVQHHANSSADAHQVTISDPIGTGLSGISNVDVTTTGSLSAPTYSTTGGTLSIPASGSFSFPDDGSTLVITYQTQVNAGANTVISNSAIVDWASTATSVSETRQSGSGTYDMSESNATGLNDYRNESTDSSVATDSPTISKLLIETSSATTSDATTPVELAPGETSKMYLKVAMPEGLTSTLLVTDDLAPNVAYLSHQIITASGNSNGNLTQNFGGTVSSPSCTTCVAESIGPELVFEFTNVDVTADGDGTNNYFIVEIVVRAITTSVNDGIPPGQTTFSNQSSIRANGGVVNTSGTLSFIIVEPELTISKEFSDAVDADVISPNQLITVHSVIENNGTTAAHNVLWSDNLDSVHVGTMQYQSGTLSAVCSAGVTQSMVLNDSTAPTISGVLESLPVGESCDVVFTVRVNPSLDASVYPVVSNSASVQWTSLAGTVPQEKVYAPVSDSDIVTIHVPDMVLTKTDGQSTAIPNEILTYVIAIDNVGLSDATDVVITETVPENTTFLPANSTSGWGCTPNSSSGSVCTFNVSSLMGEAFTPATPVYEVEFSVQVNNPLAPEVVTIINTATVSHNTTYGIDPTPLNNTATDSNTIIGAVDLVLTKDDSVTHTSFNSDLVYTLNYQNQGTISASGVTITETVPANTEYSSGLSTPGWACLPDNTAGSTCTFSVGNVLASTSGSVTFGVRTADYPPVYLNVQNTASIADDGTHGPEITMINNQSTITTPVQYSNVFDPPSSFKTVTPNGDTVLTWQMVWINDGNATALNVRIVDLVPVGTTYVNGSFTCDARGSSTTSLCTFDSINNRVIWEGNIASDIGGTNESNSLHEVVLVFQTTVNPGVEDAENQAQGFWDDNNSGSVDDDILAGQLPVLTNDPTTTPGGDPTAWRAAHLVHAGNSSQLVIVTGIGTLLILGSLVTFILATDTNDRVRVMHLLGKMSSGILTVRKSIYQRLVPANQTAEIVMKSRVVSLGRIEPKKGNKSRRV